MTSSDWKSNKFNSSQKRKERAPVSRAPAHLKFVAKFQGKCIHCDEPIRLGDLIRRRGDKYAHDRCILVIRENVKPKVDQFRANIPKPREQIERIELWVDLLGREHHTRIRSDGSREKID